MYEIIENNWHIIPLDFVNFLELLEEYKQRLVFTKGFALTSDTAIKINDEAIKNQDTYYALDMKNIDEVPGRLNLKLSSNNKNIVFFNISEDNTAVKERLNGMYQNDLFWPNNTIACFNNDNAIYSRLKELDNKEYRIHEQNRILRSLVSYPKEPLKLASSGLFCNCYVNIKNLFSDTHGLQYTIFSMASLLKGELASVDAFITSSRNGAILASILGGLLNIKEVHLIGIGPKYAARLGDSVECIRKNKHYAYIFDFMCTGTEMKIVRALINSKKAFLTKSVGIARVYKEDDDDFKNNSKIKVLTDTRNAEIEFRIAATSNDLLALIKEKEV